MFGFWDWLVVGVYITGTTLVGHHLKGRQKTTRDFFLGGRNLPWYAVSASTIATTISAVTFIGVPALVFAENGNFVEGALAANGFLFKSLWPKAGMLLKGLWPKTGILLKGLWPTKRNLLFVEGAVAESGDLLKGFSPKTVIFLRWL